MFFNFGAPPLTTVTSFPSASNCLCILSALRAIHVLKPEISPVTHVRELCYVASYRWAIGSDCN